MLATALEYFNFTLVCSLASLCVGVVFSTKITDYVKGVPSELRTALSALEKDALNKVMVAKAEAIAKVTGVKAAIPAPAAPAPAAVAQPAPAPAPAPSTTA